MKPGSFGIWLIAEKCDLSTGGWEGHCRAANTEFDEVWE